MPDPSDAYRDAIRSFITTNFYVPDPQAIKDDTSFLTAGIVDSTGVMEVVSFVEATFSITVADSELLPENLDSIGGLVRFVARKKGG